MIQTRVTNEGPMADDLDRYIADRDSREPGFADLVAAAEQRRAFARKMAAVRRRKELSQTQVAAAMQTSASIVSRLENGVDVRISTLEKYVGALGFELELKAKKITTVSRKSAKRASRKTKKRTVTAGRRKVVVLEA